MHNLIEGFAGPDTGMIAPSVVLLRAKCGELSPVCLAHIYQLGPREDKGDCRWRMGGKSRPLQRMQLEPVI